MEFIKLIIDSYFSRGYQFLQNIFQLQETIRLNEDIIKDMKNNSEELIQKLELEKQTKEDNM